MREKVETVALVGTQPGLQPAGQGDPGETAKGRDLPPQIGDGAERLGVRAQSAERVERLRPRTGELKKREALCPGSAALDKINASLR